MEIDANERGERRSKMERETKEMASRKQGSCGAAVSPCAACKLLRRRCVQDCIFAPYFPADEPQKFATVHKVFGASNVSKLLQVSHSILSSSVKQRRMIPIKLALRRNQQSSRATAVVVAMAVSGFSVRVKRVSTVTQSVVAAPIIR